MATLTHTSNGTKGEVPHKFTPMDDGTEVEERAREVEERVTRRAAAVAAAEEEQLDRVVSRTPPPPQHLPMYDPLTLPLPAPRQNSAKCAEQRDKIAAMDRKRAAVEAVDDEQRRRVARAPSRPSPALASP